MTKTAVIRLMFMFVLAWSVSGTTSQADIILDFEFIGSGQTFSPTDDVEIQGRITNNGDMALDQGIGFGGITIPDRIFNQYFEAFPPGIAFSPPGLVSLNPGESIDWRIALYQPFPITGNPGDPVDLGLYTLPITDDFLITFTVFNPFRSILVNTSQAGDFIWNVVDGGGVDPQPVPEPASILALACGLLGLAGWRWKRRA